VPAEAKLALGGHGTVGFAQNGYRNIGGSGRSVRTYRRDIELRGHVVPLCRGTGQDNPLGPVLSRPPEEPGQGQDKPGHVSPVVSP
jgi:hypothetical protein